MKVVTTPSVWVICALILRSQNQNKVQNKYEQTWIWVFAFNRTARESTRYSLSFWTYLFTSNVAGYTTLPRQKQITTSWK